MRLNDFVKKPAKVKKQARFVLKNEAADLRHQAQIDDLNQQLGQYRGMEAERDEAIHRLTNEQEKFKELGIEADKLHEQIDSLQQTIADQEQVLEKIPELEEATKSAIGDYSQISSELDRMTKTAMEQSKAVSALGNQVNALQADNDLLSTDMTKARADKISAEEEFRTVKNKNVDLENFASQTSKINKGLVEEVKELKDFVSFWQKESQEVGVQLEESKVLESKLRQWVTNLEKQDSQNVKTKGVMEQKVSTLNDVIKDMSTTLEDLIKEMNYLRSLNKEYRNELSRPRYLSMGAIAKREGFVMPQGKENIRTHNLGNSAPTLLKFKSEEGSYGR